jgi:hypothetical protein
LKSCRVWWIVKVLVDALVQVSPVGRSVTGRGPVIPLLSGNKNPVDRVLARLNGHLARLDALLTRIYRVRTLGVHTLSNRARADALASRPR